MVGDDTTRFRSQQVLTASVGPQAKIWSAVSSECLLTEGCEHAWQSEECESLYGGATGYDEGRGSYSPAGGNDTQAMKQHGFHQHENDWQFDFGPAGGNDTQHFYSRARCEQAEFDERSPAGGNDTQANRRPGFRREKTRGFSFESPAGGNDTQAVERHGCHPCENVWLNFGPEGSEDTQREQSRPWC